MNESAKPLKIELLQFDVRAANDIPGVFQAARKAKVQALTLFEEAALFVNECLFGRPIWPEDLRVLTLTTAPSPIRWENYVNPIHVRVNVRVESGSVCASVCSGE